MKFCTAGLDKKLETDIMFVFKCDDEASFLKPVHREKERVRNLQPCREAATSERFALSETVDPRYPMT